jgi:hypothetical protein
MRGVTMRTLLITILVTVGFGISPASASQSDPEDDDNEPYLQLSGFYAFNGYSQNNFFFGKFSDRDTVGGVSDKDEYSIQLFRLTGEFGRGENLKAVVRVDMAQGIWGIDNSRNERELRGGFSNLFNRKDTNFLVHLDWAYVDYTYPKWRMNFKVGRQKHMLGNMLILDQDSDGFQISKMWDGSRLSFFWAKMSEGADSLSDQDATGPGGVSTKDATLYTLNYTHPIDRWKVNPYFAYYRDDGYAAGVAYVPNGLQYFRARFTPHLNRVSAFGLAVNGTAGTWKFRGELDYLNGKDKIPNENSGPNELVDVNNGDLSGYNAYLEAITDLGPGQLGFDFGLGSGDEDPMSGKGNINKIRTQGFFYVTEVWEDSIMPDEQGITPQGLGSPASRGYRELENTTLFQASYTWNINAKLTYLIYGAWIRATEKVLSWSDRDGNGAIDPGEMGPESSNDLGKEFGMRLDWNLLPGLTWVFRGGAFWPGDGAVFLINGNDRYKDTAYELRTTIRFSFGGIRLGG